ncbi:hypothetical protein, no similarity [Maudiozyma saulgeensis]|uniref:Uncharacterized protein n=1 Tax=Maudiozyma saulgeensis TaxID=1789683 RepID=A0A1X7R011_9SACH|nr:hypothetical protein, no similarity [Kazachstania saulgeensis]
MAMTTVLKKLLPFAFPSRTKQEQSEDKNTRRMVIVSRSIYKKQQKNKNAKVNKKDIEQQQEEPKFPIDYKAPNNDPMYIEAIDEAIRYKLIHQGNESDISTLTTIGRIITQYQKDNNPYRQHYNGVHIVRNPSTNSDNSNNEIINKDTNLNKQISIDTIAGTTNITGTRRKPSKKNRNTMIDPLNDVTNNNINEIHLLNKRSTNTIDHSGGSYDSSDKPLRKKLQKSKSKSSRLDKLKINKMIIQTNTESVMKGMYYNKLKLFNLNLLTPTPVVHVLKIKF